MKEIHNLNHSVKEEDTEAKGRVCCSLPQSLWKKICVRSYSIGPPQGAKGLASGEMRQAEDLTTEFELNCALSSLRCRKWAERRQNVTDFMSGGFVHPHANTVFSFLIFLHETTHLWFAL